MQATRLFLATAATPALPFLVMAVLHNMGAPVLLTALIGTIAMSSAMVALARDPEPAARNLARFLTGQAPEEAASRISQVIALSGASVGLVSAAGLSGAAPGFFCQEQLVPFNAAIPFGLSFAAGFLGQAIQIRGSNAEISVFAGIAFFWIAPFYGFFMPPVFLAISLGARCVQYTAGNIAIASVLLLLGAWAGRRVADRLLHSGKS